MWYIKSFPWLDQLTPQQCEQLERGALSRSFPKGSIIYLQAELPDGVLLVAKGRVRISNITPQGKQAILAYVEPGELFGEQALLDDSPREEHAEAVEKSQIILLPILTLRKLMEQSPHITLGFTRLIGLRRRRIERRLKSLLFRSNRDRLIHLLLDFAEQYGKETPRGIQIALKLSHQDIAGLIGSTRESVTVLLSELRAAGLVGLARRTVTLQNLPALRGLLNESVPRSQTESTSPQQKGIETPVSPRSKAGFSR